MRRRKIDKTDLPESEEPTDKDEAEADGTDVEESVVVSDVTRGVEESACKDERDSTDDTLASEDRGDGFASLTLRRERWNDCNTC